MRDLFLWLTSAIMRQLFAPDGVEFTDSNCDYPNKISDKRKRKQRHSQNAHSVFKSIHAQVQGAASHAQTRK